MTIAITAPSATATPAPIVETYAPSSAKDVETSTVIRNRAYDDILLEAREYDPLPKAMMADITDRVVGMLDKHTSVWARCLGENSTPFFEESPAGAVSKGRSSAATRVSPEAAMMCAECPIRPQCAEQALNNLSSHAMTVMAGVLIPYSSRLPRTSRDILESAIGSKEMIPDLVRWYVTLSATSLRYHSGDARLAFRAVRGRLPRGIFRYVCDYLVENPVSSFTVELPKVRQRVR